MTAKEYLEQAKYLDRQIESKMKYMEKLNSMMYRTSSISSLNTGSSRDPGKNEKYLIKIFELKNEIKRDIVKLLEINKDISDTISSIPNREYQLLLELRYIDMSNWQIVADCMGISMRSVHLIHAKALKEVEARINSIAA